MQHAWVENCVELHERTHDVALPDLGLDSRRSNPLSFRSPVSFARSAKPNSLSSTHLFKPDVSPLCKLVFVPAD